MHAAGVGGDAEIGERIDLAADCLRHFLELDPIVAQQGIALHLILQLPPGCQEAIGRDVLRKVGREQRRVVVAQLLAQPAKASGRKPRRDAQRQQESGLTVAVAADGDGRTGAVAPANVSMPGRQPVERLERGAIGKTFEPAPLGFDRGQVAVDAQAQIGRRLAPMLPAAGRNRRLADVDRRAIGPERRQCRRPCHSIHRQGWSRTSA